jgi:hypothetical protein
MIAATCSPGMSEATSGAHLWPVTTKVWLVATLLVDDGADDAYLTTYTSDSPSELAPTISGMPGTLVEMLCVVPLRGRWVPHRVTELWTGTLGQTPVVVFRDATGRLFCPEMPDCPASAVQELKLIRLVGRPYAASVQPSSPDVASEVRHGSLT